MICVAGLLLLVPGMLAWKIAGGKEPGNGKEMIGALVSWLIHDLMIVCMAYAMLYVAKGVNTVSFSSAYLDDMVYYSIYDISFIFRYSAYALCAAVVLGAAERVTGAMIRGRKKQ